MPLVPIPERINDVAIEFAPHTDRVVVSSMLDLLVAAIHPGVAQGFRLDTLYISCAADRVGHQPPSRHTTREAVDISRINRKRMSVFYPSDPEARAITDAMIRSFQICGPTFVARELFGPGTGPHGFKFKLGVPYPRVRDHRDHIHLSEGDRESIDGCPWHTV